MAKRFLARSHKLSAKWADIMSKRDWQSQTPESFRGALAAWHWCREWNSMPAVGRPRLGAAWQTCLLPERELLLGPNDSPLFVLGCAKWGAIALGLSQVTPGDAEAGCLRCGGPGRDIVAEMQQEGQHRLMELRGHRSRYGIEFYYEIVDLSGHHEIGM